MSALIRSVGPETPTFRAPPHNFEAEQALLGAILVNNEAFDRVSSFLKPEHFYDALHGRIYDHAAKLIFGGKARDADHAQDLLPGRRARRRADRPAISRAACRQRHDHHQCRGLRAHHLRPRHPPQPHPHRREHGQHRLRRADRRPARGADRGCRAEALRACRDRKYGSGFRAFSTR